jgi:hypothetical protein
MLGIKLGYFTIGLRKIDGILIRYFNEGESRIAIDLEELAGDLLVDTVDAGYDQVLDSVLLDDLLIEGFILLFPWKYMRLHQFAVVAPGSEEFDEDVFV